MIARVLVGLMALFFFAMGVQFWFALDASAAQFQIEAAGALGRASIRADVGAFFLSVGLFCGYAAWKQCGGAAAAADRGRIAERGRSTARLPFPYALPAGRTALPDGGATLAHGRAGPRGGLPPRLTGSLF